MNLNLRSVCVRLDQVSFTTNEVKFKYAGEKPATIERDGNLLKATAEAHIFFRTTHSIYWGMKENIDEIATIATFRKIQNLKRFNYSSTTGITTVNLAKAMKEFEDAMNERDILSIFKHLYNTIELAANYDGSNDKDHSLDLKIANLTGESMVDVEKWRKWYNRTKHVDATSAEVASLLQSIGDLPLENTNVRRCANATILARLR